MNTKLPLALSRLLALFAIPILLCGCEHNTNDADATDMQEYLDGDPVTFDNKPGSTHLNTTTALTLSPAISAIGATGDSIVFIAAGGQAPYEWGVSNPQFGYLEVRNGNPAVYHSTALRENAIFVKDRKGNVASSTINVVAP